MTELPKPPQQPAPTQPVVDRQGRMTKEWFDYFAALRAHTLLMGTGSKVREMQRA
jgi:hypothetical protein